MTYRAPLRDILFSLDDVVAIGGLKAAGAFPDLSADLTEQILAEAARLAEDIFAPADRTGDVQGCTLQDGAVKTPDGFCGAYRAFAEGGWQGVSAPTEHGGMGLPRAVAAAVGEMINGANMALSLAPLLTMSAIEALSAHGSDEQKRLYLPKLVSGQWSGAMNLTEPQAGTDLGAVTMRAERAEDGSWRLSGQKIFITWGEHDCAENIVHLVLARTPDAPAGSRGLSLFLAPKFLPDADGNPGARNALSCIGLEEKLGIHGSPTCVMDYRGATAWLVGAENRGLPQMFTMMNAARLQVGVQGVGVGVRAYQRALAYAQERRQGRGPDGAAPAPIVQHPDVRRMLTSMKAKLEAARHVCLATAVAADYAAYDETEEDRAYAARREQLLSMAAPASSRRRARRSIIAMRASRRSTKARTASRRWTLLAGS
jgi:alkylation response protein AidB-like acyl-CoA dehydrogenase